MQSGNILEVNLYVSLQSLIGHRVTHLATDQFPLIQGFHDNSVSVLCHYFIPSIYSGIGNTANGMREGEHLCPRDSVA